MVLGIVLLIVQFSLPALSRLAMGTGVTRSATMIAGKLKLARMHAMAKRRKVALVMLTENVAQTDGYPMQIGGGDFYGARHCGQDEICRAYRIGYVSDKTIDDVSTLVGNSNKAFSNLIYDWISEWEFTLKGTAFSEANIKGAGEETGGTEDASECRIHSVMYKTPYKNGKIENYSNQDNKGQDGWVTCRAFVFGSNGVLEKQGTDTEYSIILREGFYKLVLTDTDDIPDFANSQFQPVGASPNYNIAKITINKYTGQITITEGADAVAAGL